MRARQLRMAVVVRIKFWMRNRNEYQLPSDVEQVAEILHAHRASPDSAELDRLKKRSLARFLSHGPRRRSLKTHLAAVLAVVGLVAGSGGALAIAGSGSSNSAAYAQYCPPHFHKKHGKCVRNHKKHHHKKHHEHEKKHDHGHDKKHDH